MIKFIYIISFLLLPSLIFAQTNISRVSLDMGIERNYQSDLGNDDFFAFSPGVKLGGTFIFDYLEWDLGLSYWNDGIHKEFPITDTPTYSYSSSNLGIHLNYFTQKLIIPLHFISGVSTRLVREKHVGGGNYFGSYRNDNSFLLNTLDFGAGLNVNVTTNVRIRLDGLLSMPFAKKYVLDSGGRGSSLKIGIDYFIPH